MTILFFSDNDLGQSPSINLNVQSDNENNKRKGAIAGFIILGVFLMIILIAATCAGICIAALGSSIPIAFFGILVATGAIVASVFIMTAIARKIHRLKAG